MNICLVNPPSETTVFVREGRCETTTDPDFYLPPPTFLAQIAAVLEKHGFACKILDCGAQKIPTKDALLIIKDFQTDLLVVNVSTISLKYDLAFVKKAKAELGLLMVGVGPHGTSVPEDLLKNEVDYVVRGEPELPILELACSKNQSDVRKVKGLSYIDSTGSVHNNMDSDPVLDLDSLPLPARHLIDQSLYRAQVLGGVFTGIRSSRGCYYHCSYCEVSKMSKGIRFRSVNNIVDEIESVVQNYGIRRFIFWDELFTADKKRILSFCEEVKRRKLKIKFMCNSRADYADPIVLKALSQVGCIGLSFGIESGSQRILNLNNKQADINKFAQGIINAKKAKLVTIVYIIVGLRGENRSSIDETKVFLRKTNPDIISVSYAVPFPGTELYHYAKENDLLLFNDWLQLGEKFGTVKMRTEYMNEDDLVTAYHEIYDTYTYRSAFFINHLKRVRIYGAKNLLNFAMIKYAFSLLRAYFKTLIRNS